MLDSGTAYILSLCLGGLILILHPLSVYLKGTLGKCISYANILLHLPEAFLLLFGDFALDECALFFMLSIAVYCLSYFVRYKLEHRAVAKKEADK